MERNALIKSTIRKIQQLPDKKIKEVADFTEFLINKIDDQIITDNIQELVSKSKTYEFLANEEDLYSVNDLKERYK